MRVQASVARRLKEDIIRGTKTFMVNIVYDIAPMFSKALKYWKVCGLTNLLPNININIK